MQVLRTQACCSCCCCMLLTLISLAALCTLLAADPACSSDKPDVTSLHCREDWASSTLALGCVGAHIGCVLALEHNELGDAVHGQL